MKKQFFLLQPASAFFCVVCLFASGVNGESTNKKKRRFTGLSLHSLTRFQALIASSATMITCSLSSHASSNSSGENEIPLRHASDTSGSFNFLPRVSCPQQHKRYVHTKNNLAYEEKEYLQSKSNPPEKNEEYEEISSGLEDEESSDGLEVIIDEVETDQEADIDLLIDQLGKEIMKSRKRNVLPDETWQCSCDDLSCKSSRVCDKEYVIRTFAAMKSGEFQKPTEKMRVLKSLVIIIENNYPIVCFPSGAIRKLAKLDNSQINQSIKNIFGDIGLQPDSEDSINTTDNPGIDDIDAFRSCLKTGIFKSPPEDRPLDCYVAVPHPDPTFDLNIPLCPLSVDRQETPYPLTALPLNNSSFIRRGSSRRFSWKPKPGYGVNAQASAIPEVESESSDEEIIFPLMLTPTENPDMSVLSELETETEISDEESVELPPIPEEEPDSL